MKIFIDVDNTILEHSHFYTKDVENRVHTAIAKNTEKNYRAIKSMYDSAIASFPNQIRRLWLEDSVYILTKYPNLEYDKYKQIRLAEVLGITLEELVNTKNKNGINKYLNIQLEVVKVEFVKKIFKTDQIDDFILIDDYSENIIEWENAGGIGLKYYNEYNSPNHPNMGITITNFKLFETFFDKKRILKIFFKYDKSLFLENEVDYIINELNPDLIVNTDELIYKDSLKKLKFNNEKNNEYPYLKFAKEYYKLVDKIDPEYWTIFWKEYLISSKYVVFKKSFDIKLNKMCNSYLKEEDYLFIKILKDKKKVKNRYDVFITIEQDKHYIEGMRQLGKINKIMEQILINNF